MAAVTYDAIIANLHQSQYTVIQRVHWLTMWLTPHTPQIIHNKKKST